MVMMTIGRRMAVRSMGRLAHQQRMKSSQAMAMDDHSYMATPGPVTTLTEEETMFKDTVARFAADVIKPRVKEMDRTGTLDRAILTGLFDNGLMSVEVPSQYGGSEASFMSLVLTIEELSKVEPSVGLLVNLQNTVVNTIIQLYATEKQKEEYLPRLSANTVGSFCLSEAGSGSDAFALKTRADVSADGSYYTLNGSKMWISNAEYADVFVVLATVDPSKGYKGITGFLVDREMEGLEISPPEDKLGIRASSTCTVTLNNVKVKKENVLGEVGKGYRIAMSQLNESRIGIASQMLGLAQGAFDQTIPYLYERHQFGRAIGDFQAMQHQQAEAALDLEMARLLVYNAARAKDAGTPAAELLLSASMAKLQASRVAEKTASKCVEWMGGVGFTRDLPAEKFYRDAKIGSIYGGTSNIQLSAIGKLVKDKYTK